MSGLSLFPIFMVGLLGGVHCVGMCGGIVSALSATSPARRAFPVAVVTSTISAIPVAALQAGLYTIAYNIGRIGSYAAAGAIAGGVAGGVRTLSGLSALQSGGYWLANLMLVALGLYLMDAWRGLAHFERAGRLVWRYIQPLIKPLLPMDSPGKALALGALWGWLPCGLVYSVLLTAMLSGSALSGATVMLAFGVGTLPTLVAAGLLGAQIKPWVQRRAVRGACGIVVLVFGLLGLMRASGGPLHGWLDLICLSPPAAGTSR